MNPMNFYHTMLENIDEGVYFVDTKRTLTFWNKGAEKITGFSSDEILGRKCFSNILNHVDEQGTHLCHNGCPLHQTLSDGMERINTVYLHHKDGNRVPVKVKVLPIKENDTIVGAVEIFTDESLSPIRYKELENYKMLAMMDQLTDIPNRRYVDSFLESKLREAKDLAIPFGILFIDIDHFKMVNDTYGHDIGDEILKMVAKTTSSVIRSTDLLGRFGGEEFIAILTGMSEDFLLKKAEQLRMLIENSRKRLGDGNDLLGVTVSIGATMYQEDSDIKDIIKRADTLLYKAKESGRNQVCHDIQS